MAFRPIRLPIPSASARSSFTIKEFKGVDKASGEDNFSPGRAIEMQNFIRSKVGQIQKRGGFNASAGVLPEWIEQWGDFRICFAGQEVIITMSRGEGAQEYAEALSTILGVQTIFSATGYVSGDSYYFLAHTDQGAAVMKYNEFTGAEYVIYPEGKMIVGAKDIVWGKDVADTTAPNMVDGNFIPISAIVENAHPDGNGRTVHDPNVLTPFVQETFTVATRDFDYPEEEPTKCARFQLSNKNLQLRNGDDILSSEDWMNEENGYWTTDGYRKLNSAGEAILRSSVKVEAYRRVVTSKEPYYKWVDVTKLCFRSGEVGFLNTEAGALWIPGAAIGEAPKEDEPNVRITYMRDMSEMRKTLSGLAQSKLRARYGVGGYKDRLFVAAGNRIYYSGMDDPLYFGELNYVEPCSADKSIVAMGGQGKYLYAVDDTGVTYAIGGTVLEDDSNTFLADAAFVILDHVQGEKPVGNILDVFGDEFCYLSEEGLVAIRHDDFYDKRYAQNRSRMLGNELKDKELCACRFGNFLVIGAGQKLHFLDEMQQTSLPDFKYSGKQYEIFPFSFSNEFVTALGGNDWHFQKVWVEKDKLYAYTGTHVLEYDPELFVDKVRGGETYPICAQWITPPFTLSSFYRKKNILQLSLRVGEVGSAVKVEYRVDGDTANKENEEWRLLRNYDGRFRVFNYGNINYGLWTYNCDIPKLQLIMNRRPSRKCYSIQFRFTNDTTDKLSLSDFGFTYETEGI